MITTNLTNKEAFYVIVYDINIRRFKNYDVIPFFLYDYNQLPKRNRPKTREEIERFIYQSAKYQFWSRCEYELLLVSWPNEDVTVKIDVYEQIRMNLCTVVDIFMRALAEDKKRNKNKKTKEQSEEI